MNIIGSTHYSLFELCLIAVKPRSEYEIWFCSSGRALEHIKSKLASMDSWEAEKEILSAIYSRIFDSCDDNTTESCRRLIRATGVNERRAEKRIADARLNHELCRMNSY